MPKTRRQEAANTKDGVSKSTRSGVALADDASSAHLLNNMHRPPKKGMKVARKFAPSARQPQQPEQEAPESYEDVEDALNKQLNENNGDPSGLEPEDMTKELEIAQPTSPAEKKRGAEKENRDARDGSQLQSASPQKRKRDEANVYDFIIGEDEQDIRSAHSKRASKDLQTKSIPKRKQYIVKPKKGQGQPNKNAVDESEDFEEDFPDVADIGNGDSTVNQEPEQPDVGASFNDRRGSVRKTRDDDGGRVDDGENESDEDDGSDGITEIAMPLTPAESQRQISREQHKKNANIARTISSNHANSFHNNRAQSSREVRSREEQIGDLGKELGELEGEPGEVPDNVGEEANVATAADVPEQREAAKEQPNEDTEEDEDDSYQEISQQLVAWNGIINFSFFLHIEQISNRFGCRATNGTWIPVVLEKRGLVSTPGKSMGSRLGKLKELYQSLKGAINAENDDDQNQSQFRDRANDNLQALEENAPDRVKRKRRRYLEDIYIVLIREFLRVLKAAILTYGNLTLLSIEALSNVIRITNVILKLFKNLEDQENLESCGQTKQPMREVRKHLRDELLQKMSNKEEEDARLETERMEQERMIREFNSTQQKTIMASPKKASLIELEMERIAYRKLPQAERVRLELEAENKKRLRRPMQQIPQLERERSAASSQRSQSNDSDGNDPFSDNYDPPRGAKREAKFGDIPDDEKQRFYNHFKERYRYEEEQGLKDEEFWGRLQKDLHGGRYTLDEIWGFAKELQASLDFAHDEGEFHGEEHFWTFYVWDWDMES
ncbi:hypothetical protein H4I96_08041 [Botrytis cinerea]